MSELYDTDEMPEGTFPLSLKLIDRYQREDPCLQARLTCANYHNDPFRGGRNIIELVMYKDKIFIPQKLQK